MYTKEQIASVLDYEVLNPHATIEDVRDAGAFCNKHKLHGLMVASVNVEIARKAFGNVIARIGGPHGNVSVQGKFFEATEAIYSGAAELNVVANFGRFLGGNQTIINWELDQICKMAAQHRVLVTATIEASRFTTTQLVTAAEQCILAGVDFIQLGSYFVSVTTGSDVETLLSVTRGTDVGVKVSGLNRDDRPRTHLKQFLDSGCARIGSTNLSELLP